MSKYLEVAEKLRGHNNPKMCMSSSYREFENAGMIGSLRGNEKIDVLPQPALLALKEKLAKASYAYSLGDVMGQTPPPELAPDHVNGIVPQAPHLAKYVPQTNPSLAWGASADALMMFATTVQPLLEASEEITVFFNKDCGCWFANFSAGSRPWFSWDYNLTQNFARETMINWYKEMGIQAPEALEVP